MIPYSRPKRSDLYTQLLENHTLHSGTYLYSPNPPPPGGYGQEKYWKCTGEIYIPTGVSSSFPLLSSSLFFLALWLRTGKACSHLDVHVKQNLWESLSPIHSSDMSFFIEKRAGFIEHNGLKYWQLGQPVDGMFVFVQHDTVFRDKDKGQHFCHTFKFQYTWLHPK